MNREPRPAFVALVLAACAAAAICNLAWPAGGDLPVEMRAEEIVRVGGGQPILVLAEKNGARRLGVPVSRAEAASIEAALRGSRGPGMAVIESLGGRIVRASIDGARSRHDFRGHLSLGSGAREVLIEASAGEALSLALQAGAQNRRRPGAPGGSRRDRGRAARRERAQGAPRERSGARPRHLIARQNRLLQAQQLRPTLRSNACARPRSSARWARPAVRSRC